MHNTIIVRYGELALKGKNRHKFENRLVENIRDCLKKNRVTFDRVYKKRGRLYVQTKDKCNNLSHVFGITSFSYAVKGNFTIENLKKTISRAINEKKFDTFRVTAHRLDKSISYDSQELNNLMGKYVADEFKKSVSLKNFDLEIGIDIQENNFYFYTERIKGLGGLPYGINGKTFALIEDRKSLLAAILVMKRGLRIYPVSKKQASLSLLQKYNYGYKPLILSV